MNDMSPVRPASVSAVLFSGERRDFGRLVRRGALLELATLGFYRFWLATDMRRHLWSHISIDGDGAEYTGTGRELLVGFLFALAILLPIYILYFFVGIEAERAKAFASIPLFVFFYLFGQFAIFRARRYRVTRTVFRGIRFWMTGSGLAYAGRASLWGLLVIVSLGFALPWREASLERYKMRHTLYGDLQGSFEGTGLDLFKRGWWLWLLTPVALVVFPALPFLYAAFKAVEWRWWLSGLRFGGVSVEARLSRTALVGLYWKVIGWYFLVMVALVAYVVAATFAVGQVSGTDMDELFAPGGGHLGLLASWTVGYLLAVVVLNIVVRVYLIRDLWALLCVSVTVRGIEAAGAVSAKGLPSSALGEGLADGLDVAGF